MKPTAARIKEASRCYLKVVEWSEEDGCYLGSAPPIIGHCCHGSSEAEVLARYDQKLWTAGLRRKLGKRVQAAFSATPSMKRPPSISLWICSRPLRRRQLFSHSMPSLNIIPRVARRLPLPLV